MKKQEVRLQIKVDEGRAPPPPPHTHTQNKPTEDPGVTSNKLKLL